MYSLSNSIDFKLDSLYYMQMDNELEDMNYIESIIEDELGGFKKNPPKSKQSLPVVKSKSNKRDKAKLREEKRGWE